MSQKRYQSYLYWAVLSLSFRIISIHFALLYSHISIILYFMFMVYNIKAWGPQVNCAKRLLFGFLLFAQLCAVVGAPDVWVGLGGGAAAECHSC